MKLLAMSVLALTHALMLSAGEKPAEVKPEKPDPEELKKAVAEGKGALTAEELEQLIICGKEYTKLQQMRSAKANVWYMPIEAAGRRLGAGPDDWDEKEFSTRAAQIQKLLGVYSGSSYVIKREFSKGCGEYIGNAKDKAQFASRWDTVCTFLASFGAGSSFTESSPQRGLEKFIELHDDLKDEKAQLNFINQLLTVIKNKEGLLKYKKIILGEDDKTKKGEAFPPRK